MSKPHGQTPLVPSVRHTGHRLSHFLQGLGRGAQDRLLEKAVTLWGAYGDFVEVSCDQYEPGKLNEIEMR